MNSLLTANHGKIDGVFDCSGGHQKYPICWVSRLSPFLRGVNTRTVAFTLFVILALLSGGRHGQSSGSGSAKDSRHDIAIDQLTSPVIASAENQFEKSAAPDRDQNFTSAVAKTYPYACPIASDAPAKLIHK